MLKLKISFCFKTENVWYKPILVHEQILIPLRSRNKTGVCFSMFGADSPSAGAPGIPLPGEGTITAFLSSVRHTHWSSSALSRSESASLLSKCNVYQLKNIYIYVNLSFHISNPDISVLKFLFSSITKSCNKI